MARKREIPAMGYRLMIGEAEFEYFPEDLILRVSARINRDQFQGCVNAYSVSYGRWKHMCEETGLFELFYGGGWCRDLREYKYCSEDFHREAPLFHRLASHAVLCQGDADLIAARLEAYRADSPAHTAEDFLFCLEWLDHWVRWALANCERPIITNY